MWVCNYTSIKNINLGKNLRKKKKLYVTLPSALPYMHVFILTKSKYISQILNSKLRDIMLPTKVNIVKTTVFPVVVYRCESWTIKKPEHQRIDAFKLWWWRRLLRVPWTARRSNHSILKEINPEYLLEGLMLKLQYFGYLMQRADIGKDPEAGKDWEQEEKGASEDETVGWHHWCNGHELQQTLGNSERQRSLARCSSWVAESGST